SVNPAPTYLALLMTNRCNLRCTYCFAAGGEGPKREIPPEMARAAVDYVCANAQAQGRPSFLVNFHGGGEPVRAWETLVATTEYARAKPIPAQLTIVSNGVWTKREREWLMANMDGVSLSFDGAQETQDRQRPMASGRGSFRAVMRTIAALEKAGSRYGIRMTATAPWRETLPRDVAFLCEHTNCRSFQVEPAFNTARGERQGPTPEESEAFIEGFMAAYEIARTHGRDLGYSGARPWLLSSAFCSSPFDAVIVSPSGALVVCYELSTDIHPLMALGTVGRVDGEGVAFDAEARARLAEIIAARQQRCADCFCQYSCAGDCLVRGAWDEPGMQWSGRCEINRELTAQLLLWNIMANDGVWRGRTMLPEEAQLWQAF
ncbi:MAG: radical SAM protein, partial [Chloroflexi bacterium]|nr:radical SAM protein [Chloroflexota bacterium]